MTKRFTLTLGICMAAAAVTTGALFSRPSAPPVRAGATPTEVGVADSTPDAGRPATITIEGFTFSTQPVAAGARVVVDNLDGAPHTVSGEAFDVGLDPGGTASFTAPAQPGTYSFVCFVHPTMTGELVVL